MTVRHTVTFAASAVEDLEGVLAWYAEQGVPEVGKRLVAEIVSAVDRLRSFPLSGRVVPEFGIDGLREIVHPPFRIVYRGGEGRVRVLRVWRSERLLTAP